MATGLLEQARNLDQTFEVAMDEVRFLAFQQGSIRCIGTVGLNGCTVVTIVSPFGAILAHIPPHPNKDWGDPHAGDRHVQEKMNEVAVLYHRYESYFPSGRTNWVVSAMYQGKVALPDQREIIERNLQKLRLPYANVAYLVLEADDSRGPGQGTVFIDARGEAPIVYVEDRHINLE